MYIVVPKIDALRFVNIIHEQIFSRFSFFYENENYEV